jgi:hypothetical protein
MKSSLRSRQEPRRVSNGVIIGAMLLSLCVLSIVKARYCATPFGTDPPRALRLIISSLFRFSLDPSCPAAVWLGGKLRPC